MSANNGRKCAFPVVAERIQFGLTKREYFAAMAMQGMFVARELYADPENMAENAALYADALLAELERTNDH